MDTRDDLNIQGWDIYGEPGPFCSITWSSIAGEGIEIIEDVIMSTSTGGAEDAPCGYYVTYNWIGLNGACLFKILT